MIKAYIKNRMPYFIFYLVILFFFPLVHFLYRLPMGSIIYSCILFTFFFLLWMIIDGFHYWKKVKQLDTILANITENIHNFPEAGSLIETKYQNIIENLYKLLQDTKYAMEKSHTEQTEYYTLWVHQIKTPISAMRLAIQSKENTDKSIIDQELFKIEQYVEMALQYVKMNQLSSNMAIREYALKDIVIASVKKYATLFIYKKLSIDIEDINQTVLTDSKWLIFIIEQLLSNAVKYTNQGGVHIYTEGKSLVIEDTGIGIRQEDMELIFEKGYTGYNGRMNRKSSGIGLYMVKKVADYLSINIAIHSKPGSGTKVILTFPEKELIPE